MTVLEIVKEYLENNGYDGLFDDNECGCLLTDLMPCGNMFDGCEAGYKTPCDCGEQHEYHVSRTKTVEGDI